VYGVKWNCIHHKTFLSASADWLVKLWDANQPRKPILTFDFSDAVRQAAADSSFIAFLSRLDVACSATYPRFGVQPLQSVDST